MTFAPARAECRLVYPIEVPGGSIDTVRIDLDRPGRWPGERGEISRITGPPASVFDEMAEFDYVSILLAIDRMNAPRVAAVEGR